MVRSAAALALLLAATSCTLVQPDRPAVDPKTHAPAFRSVLDGRPRMLTIDLGGDLWAAYDAETSALYKVWRDGVLAEGAVYDYRHGPQPRALGPAYVLRTGRSPWRLVVDEVEVEPRVRYRGHRVLENGVVVLSELTHGIVRVDVEEQIVRLPGASPGIEWRLRAHDVPPAVSVGMRVELDSVRDLAVSRAAQRSTERGMDGHVETTLVLEPRREASLRVRFGEPAISPEVAPEVDEGWARLESMGCPSCHATDARTVGPALTAIAERYDADPDTIDRLATKVRSGGSGTWGDAEMPAHEFLSSAQSEELVAFVLALDGDDAAARRFAGERSTDRIPSTWELLAEHGPRWLGQQLSSLFVEPLGRIGASPGDGEPLEGVHPSFDLEAIRPLDFEPKVGGMDFLPNGDLVVATWDGLGAVHRLHGVAGDDPGAVEVTEVAGGLSEPLGLRIVDGEIFVLQKHELTHLVDHDGDGRTDEYRTVANDWGATGNFHEFAFGLVARPDDSFLATLSSGVAPGGASATSQPIDRGSVIRIGRDGAVEPIARGLRTPNGIGEGALGEIFVADNQGAWLPASKIVHVRDGAFFGFRDVDPAGDATRAETPPVVWLPQDEIGNSPSEPVPLDVGPYRGQMLHGDVTHGGIKRVFVERVDGELQGAVFRFSQGLEAGVNRLVWGPDGKLYVGGIGNPGNWGHAGRAWFGLERLSYNERPTFEMLAVRARAGGFDIELTEPLGDEVPLGADAIAIDQWRYAPTAAYGGPKIDLEELDVTAATVSADRRTLTIAVAGLRSGSVVHLRLDPDRVRSADGDDLWTTEAWYTLNRLPPTSDRT